MIALDAALRRLTVCQRPWDGGDGPPARQPFRPSRCRLIFSGKGRRDIDRAALSIVLAESVTLNCIINPAIGMYKPKAPQAGDRVLTRPRSRGSGKHVIRWGTVCITAQTALLTGCRRGESPA